MGNDATIGQTLLLKAAVGVASAILFANWVVSVTREATPGLDDAPTRYEQTLKLGGIVAQQDLTGQYQGESLGDNTSAEASDTH